MDSGAFDFPGAQNVTSISIGSNGFAALPETLLENMTSLLDFKADGLLCASLLQATADAVPCLPRQCLQKCARTFVGRVQQPLLLCKVVPVPFLGSARPSPSRLPPSGL